MATKRESTTTPPASMQSTLAAPVPMSDYLIRLSAEPTGAARVLYDALLDKLDELDRAAGKARRFRTARTRLAAGIMVTWDGNAYQIGGVTVLPAPSRVRWPWRCRCGKASCWHGALCEALVSVREQQANDGDFTRVA